jgi:hypothetical protein
MCIGLVEQVHTEEDRSDCIAAYCQLMQAHRKGDDKCPYRNQINIVTLSYLDSRGPAFARALQSEVMRDEEFCMQVDSHSDVTQGLYFECIYILYIIFTIIIIINTYMNIYIHTYMNIYRLGCGHDFYVAVSR